MIPNWSSSSTAVLATSCIRGAVTSLPIEASGPGVWPRDSAVWVRRRVSRRPSACTYQSATFSRSAASLMPEPARVATLEASSITWRW